MLKRFYFFPTIIGLVFISITAISFTGCGESDEDVISTEAPVKFLGVDPAEGSTIFTDAILTLSFDNTIENIVVSIGEATISGNKVTIKGPFAEGQLSLNVEWNDTFVTLIYTVESPMTLVEIPDNQLRTEIEKQLNIESGTPITLEDMQQLIHLSITDKGISDLTVLKYATHLKALVFDNNSVQDIRPIKDLKHITYLSFTENIVQDISPLKGFTQLDTLFAWDNLIQDISPLAELTQIRELYIGGNFIEDFSPLEKLINLQRMTLSDSAFEDISPLKGLKNLRMLGLGGNKLVNIEPLKALTHLQELNLNFNLIQDISPLKELKNLRILELGDNRIADISPLVGLKKLDILELHGNPLNDASINKIIPMLEENGTEINF